MENKKEIIEVDQELINKMIKYYLNNRISKLDCIKMFNVPHRQGVLELKPHRRTELPDKLKDSIADYYINNNYSLQNTCKEFNTSVLSIKNILKERSIKKTFVKEITQDDINEAIRLRKLRLSVDKISDNLNVSCKAVLKILKDNGCMAKSISSKIDFDADKMIEFYKKNDITGNDLAVEFGISIHSAKFIFRRKYLKFSPVRTYKYLTEPKVEKVKKVRPKIKKFKKKDHKPMLDTSLIGKGVAKKKKREKVYENKPQIPGYLLRIDNRTQIYVTDGATPEVARERFLKKYNTDDRVHINPMNANNIGRKSNSVKKQEDEYECINF